MNSWKEGRKMAAKEAEIRLSSPQFEKHYRAVQQAVPREDEKGKHRSDSPQPFINKLRKHQNSFPVFSLAQK